MESMQRVLQVVGGAENYVAACRPCFLALTDAKQVASAELKPGRFGAVIQKPQHAARSAIMHASCLVLPASWGGSSRRK